MKPIIRQAILLAGFLAGWLALLGLLYLSGAPVPYADRFARLHFRERLVWKVRVLRLLLSPLTPTDADLKNRLIAAPAPPLPPVVVPPNPPPPAPVAKNPLETPAYWIPELPQLSLPEKLHAVTGAELSIYFDNVVLAKWSDALTFRVESDLSGHMERRRWCVVPEPRDIGTHVVQLSVMDLKGRPITQGTTSIQVYPREQGRTENFRLLVIGDSVTHCSGWLNELSRILDADPELTWEMLGTNSVPTALPRVHHEGYGGWSWGFFLTYNRQGTEKRIQRDRSPFLYPDPQGKLVLNAARYFREELKGQVPNLILFELGMNEVGCLDPDQPAATKAELDSVLENARTLVNHFRQAAPEAAIGVVMPPQYSASESMFPLTYAAEYTRWRSRRNNHQYLAALAQHFSSQESQRIYLIPTYAVFDAIDGYPPNVVCHPNEFGCRLYARSVYNWMKSLTYQAVESGGKKGEEDPSYCPAAAGTAGSP